MQEIRFHGRGGQGTVVASILLAKAFFKAGHWVQTSPVFGVDLTESDSDHVQKLVDAEWNLLLRKAGMTSS